MKNSLKNKLNNMIQARGYVTFEEVAKFVNEEGYKQSNMERRLRSSESPNIEPEFGTSKRGTQYIKGYYWRGAKKQQKPTVIIENDRAIFIYNG